MKTLKQKLIEVLNYKDFSLRKKRAMYGVSNGYTLVWVNGLPYEEVKNAVDSLNTSLPYSEQIRLLKRYLRFELDRTPDMTKDFLDILNKVAGKRPSSVYNQISFDDCSADRDKVLEVIRQHGYSEVSKAPSKRKPEQCSRIIKARIKAEFGVDARISKYDYRKYSVEVTSRANEVEEYILDTFPQRWLNTSGSQDDYFFYEEEEPRTIDGVLFHGAGYSVRNSSS